jgi:hypothetical protein
MKPICPHGMPLNDCVICLDLYTTTLDVKLADLQPSYDDRIYTQADMDAKLDEQVRACAKAASKAIETYCNTNILFPEVENAIRKARLEVK